MSSVPLGSARLNNHTALWMPSNLAQEVIRNSIDQNVIVFQRPGLTVYAAIWEYAFTTKAARVSRHLDGDLDQTKTSDSTTQPIAQHTLSALESKMA